MQYTCDVQSIVSKHTQEEQVSHAKRAIVPWVVHDALHEGEEYAANSIWWTRLVSETTPSYNLNLREALIRGKGDKSMWVGLVDGRLPGSTSP